MDGIWSRACAVLTLALVGTLCAAAPALATDGYVKGKKWNDTNANGVKDTGEQTIKDWWIYVDLDRDGVYDANEPKAKTDSSGNYYIGSIKWWVPNHEPRTYDVRELPASQQPDPSLSACSFPSGCKHTLTFKYSDHQFSGKDFGNYKPAKLIVKKVNVGGDQGDAFGFTTSGSGLSNFTLAASDAPKSFDSLKPGTFSVAETADARYTLTKTECSDGSSVSSIKLSSGETVTCTFTNTQKTGKIKVVKNLIPSNDTGTFDLEVNGKTVVSGGNGANATVTVPTGTNHSVAETGTTLGKYISSLSCTDGTTGTTSGSGITVTAGQTTVCTFTNERKVGKIKVVKRLAPASDSGRFDLKIGDDVVADGVGDGGEGQKFVAPGTYTVSEAGDGTDLAKYASSVECDNGLKADGPSVDVKIDSGESITCTITNTRKTGTIKVVKALLPATDAGRFDLKVGDDVVADGVGDGGNGSKQVDPGTYTVSEAGDGATDLADYLSSVACDNGVTANGTSVAVTVDSNETVTCTITNTRKADLTVTKTEGGSTTLSRDWVFTLTGGPANVDITRSTGDGNPLDFGTLAPGEYTLCETGLPDGWFSSLGVATGGKVCTQITLTAGENGEVAVDNTTPAIGLVKQVRRTGDQAWLKEATLKVGEIAEYQLTVTNEGVGPLVNVAVTDDRCDSAPAYVSGDADNDAELDESETWAYLCDHVITAGDGAQFVNTAKVDATDKRGNPVDDTDTATVKVTTPENPPSDPPTTPPTSQPNGGGAVLPEEVVSGAARMRGPSGCVSKRFNATVRGRQIARVTFFVDGRKVKRVNAKSGQRVFKLGISPTKFGKGIHRVTAKVVFKQASGTKARTLRLSFQRCARQVVAPRFTG
jgi:hypothetical protein